MKRNVKEEVNDEIKVSINSGNACCYLVQEPVQFCLLQRQ
jgi:hypothetical protein